MARDRWHPRIKPTATSGHMIPPILPTELTIPTPVVLTDIGYILNEALKGMHRDQ